MATQQQQHKVFNFKSCDICDFLTLHWTTKGLFGQFRSDKECQWVIPHPPEPQRRPLSMQAAVSRVDSSICTVYNQFPIQQSHTLGSKWFSWSRQFFPASSSTILWVEVRGANTLSETEFYGVSQPHCFVQSPPQQKKLDHPNFTRMCGARVISHHDDEDSYVLLDLIYSRALKKKTMNHFLWRATS